MACDGLILALPVAAMESHDARSLGFYPKALDERERALLERRRERAHGSRTDAPPIGVAVSGGGIRSATFALGFFQTLARVRFLRHVDFLSTVSGGSYFGAFLGGLFTPRNGTSKTTPKIEEELADIRSTPNAWLRDNGRYLAPAGGGDILTAVASQLRSFFAMHALMALLIITPFLGAFALRTWASPEWVEAWLRTHASLGIWLSPYLLVSIAVLILVVIPLGWSYWLMPGQSIDASAIIPWIMAVLVLLGAQGLVLSLELPAAGRGACAIVSLDALFTLVFAVVGLVASDARKDGFAAARRKARTRLSAWLGRALVVFGGLVIFGILDTVGQTLWAYVAYTIRIGTERWSVWKSAGLGAVPAVLAGGRMALGRLAARDGTRPGIPTTLLAGVAVTLVLGTHLSLIAGAAHAIGWGLGIPAGDPGRALVAAADCPESCSAAVSLSADHHLVVGCERCAAPAETPPTAPGPWAGYAFLATVIGSGLLGRSWSFLNLSTLHAMYSGRLTRAYLGASNPRRHDPANLEGQRVSDPITGDDIPLGAYMPFEAGGPLHLINVTINETVTGATQTEYRDRKGIGLAVGPAGLSAGATHHAVWSDAQPPPTLLARLLRRLRPGRAVPAERARRSITVVAPGEGSFAMFRGRDDAGAVENLSVGAWVGISGAAFSTGLGYRTSVALSLLAGYFNVRLGYWWDSYITPSDRKGVATPPRAPWGHILERVIPVQLYLVDEWLARFRGPGRRLWNLSDGGHFENTAAYELVRRRVPFIVLLDDGEDPEYQFEDVGNLVRKARLDFGAEIEFRKADGESFVATDLGAPFCHALKLSSAPIGPLESLRPPAAGETYVRNHATLGRVVYPDGAQSWLLLVKPTLRGDEPVDIRDYHARHATFPQESTADQFFDEAQWESYRRLGEHIANALFGGPPIAPTTFRRDPSPSGPGNEIQGAGTTVESVPA